MHPLCPTALSTSHCVSPERLPLAGLGLVVLPSRVYRTIGYTYSRRHRPLGSTATMETSLLRLAHRLLLEAQAATPKPATPSPTSKLRLQEKSRRESRTKAT